MEISIILNFILVIFLQKFPMPNSHVLIIEIINVVSSLALLLDILFQIGAEGLKKTFECTTDYYYAIVTFVSVLEVIIIFSTGNIQNGVDYDVLASGSYDVSILVKFKFILYCLRYLKFTKLCQMQLQLQ